MYKYLIILIMFLLGIYYYSYYNQIMSEGFSLKNDCPDILIQKGSRIYLKNTSLAEIPGVNPISFDNLEEYVEFMKWQKSQGIKCDVLFNIGLRYNLL